MDLSSEVDLFLLLDLDLLEDFGSLVRGDLKLFFEGFWCCEASPGGVGGFALTGVCTGVGVGNVVEGNGEVEVGVALIVAGVGFGGLVNVDFSDAAIDSILFSKVAPKRCSKACRSKGVGVVVDWAAWLGAGEVFEVSDGR